MKPCLTIAHRGASADFPENTMAAFEAALTRSPPADGMECDVRLSLDGIPVVFHDDETTRLTAKAGSIEARTIAEIATLRVRGEPVPTLDTLVQWVLSQSKERPTHLNVELKPTGHASRLIEACRPLLEPLVTHAHVDLVVSSFDPRVIAAAFDLEVPWRLAFLLESADALSFLPILEARGGLDLHPRYDLITPEFLQRYSRSGTSGMSRKVRTWTVDDESTAITLREMGVDAVITNRPQHLKVSL